MEELTLQVGSAGALLAECKLYTFGAHVTSWKTYPPGRDDHCSSGGGDDDDCNSDTAGGIEHLWMSSLSSLDGLAPIRGGIPIAFPQFADAGPMKLHGFAREKVWAVKDRSTTDTSDSVLLSLRADEDTKVTWGYPYDFQLTLSVKISATALQVILSVENLSETETMPFTGCLHTYFRTPDVSQCFVDGLQGLRYIDKVDNYLEKTQSDSSLFNVAEEVALDPRGDAEYFIDRIYLLPARPDSDPQECALDDGKVLTFTDTSGVIKRSISVQSSHSWTNWVVFNPWKTGKLGSKGPDFDDDGYKHMLCLEPTVAIPSSPIVVKPQGTWQGIQNMIVNTIA